ncbi:hypothetical protein AGLY_016322 [Aphis glycines]|uniref:CCHC-type domain-containing protein n=1 Tax=Aphis glycines TaxID=307491 RepID=A0A6G0SZI9_APHGL|nr:hypothetical protein AGLY_016322 [Aphis glycines]
MNFPMQLRPYLLNYWEGKLKKCHIIKVDERNYFGADLSHILRIKKLKKCHILKVDERNYFGADLSHILRIKKLKKCHILKRILLGREEPYIEKKIIVNLLGQKEPQGSPIVEINVKLIIEKNNKLLITNEYKNKFMNKEEENSYSENESNSSEEETDKTNTTETQVELNKNIEVEKLNSDSTQRINKEKPKEKSLLDTTVREDSNTGEEQRILGLCSTPNLVHTELGPVKRKQRTKMSSVKATIEQVTAMIPICADAKDVCSFIRACDYACEAVDRETIPLLVKFINTRITGKALEVCRYRETSDWETIKKILRGAFEQQLSPQTLQIGLNSVRMKNDEDVLTYTGRVEQLYYNLCNATLANKTPEEARILRQTLKDQALAIYINGLKMDLQTILRARNPETLELAMQMARQLEIEFSFNKELLNNENKVNQNGNKNFNGNRWSNNYQGNNSNGKNFGYKQNFNRGQNRQNPNNYNNVNRSNNFNSFGRNNNNNNSNNYPRNNNGQYNNNRRQQNNPGCYICGRTNHVARDCRGNVTQIARRNTNNNAQPQNNNARQNTNNNFNNNSAPITCSYCNKIGHDSVSCYSKQRDERNNANRSGNGQVSNGNGVRSINQITAVTEDLSLNDVSPSYHKEKQLTTKYQYVGITKNRRQFTTFTETELLHCTETETFTICPEFQPVQHESKEQLCEISLFKNPDQLPQNCESGNNNNRLNDK